MFKNETTGQYAAAGGVASESLGLTRMPLLLFLNVSVIALVI
jgi:hypothetical protein